MFDIERFDIEQRENDRRQGMTMDAVTNFELEAMRRRETVASDRGQALARSAAPGRFVARIVEPRQPRRLAAAHDCEPAPLARQAVG